MRALNPAGLAAARVPVRADARLAEGLRELLLQQRDRPVGLVAALEHRLRRVDRVERGVDVGDVEHGGTPAREEEREPAAAQQAAFRALGREDRVDRAWLGLVLLVEVLDDDLLRAVDGAARLPA